MPWIRTIDESSAGDDLARVYERIRGERGKLSNIMRIQSLHPAAMQAHMDLYMAVMFQRSGISREERELIAVVVSAANRCAYCVSHHAAALNAYWKDEARLLKLAEDHRAVELSKLTDEDILAVNLVVAYFNLVNRIALGLGVKHSEEEVGGYRY
jgi:uncharacterized peroxidase-related enzyme